MATKPAPKKLPPWLQKDADEKVEKHEKPKTVKKAPPKKKGC